MAGYCSLNPYGIIVVTERMNVRIIALSTHFALVSEYSSAGSWQNCSVSTNCIPTWNRNMVALIAEKAEILKPS